MVKFVLLTLTLVLSCSSDVPEQPEFCVQPDTGITVEGNWAGDPPEILVCLPGVTVLNQGAIDPDTGSCVLVTPDPLVTFTLRGRYRVTIDASYHPFRMVVAPEEGDDFVGCESREWIPFDQRDSAS